MPITKDLSHLLPSVIEIARSAGQLILEIYEKKDYEEFTKSDDTPVTSADLAAHKLISKKLTELTPDIPVLSEEAADISLEQRSQWDRYWLVDPLDGTQEFIARSGDFATIIALIEHNKPVMGVVYAPVSGVSYYAYSGKGAWKIPDLNDSVKIKTHHHELPNQSIAMAISRRQELSLMGQYLNDSFDFEYVALGSCSLKNCLIAEGGADCYLRIGPTGEWDTGASQCILEQAGGHILDSEFNPLSYNSRESLMNPDFLSLGNQSFCCQSSIS